MFKPSNLQTPPTARGEADVIGLGWAEWRPRPEARLELLGWAEGRRRSEARLMKQALPRQVKTS